MNPRLKLGLLVPTQNTVRDPPLMHAIADAITSGSARFNKLDPNPIEIVKISTLEFAGQYHVHNGHHRIAAMILAGLEDLQPNEYKLKRRDASEYLTFNPPHFITPFCVFTQRRNSDFKEFKKLVLMMYDLHGFDVAKQYQKDHNRVYLQTALYDNMQQLVAQYR